MERNWLIYDGIGSEEGGASKHLVVPGQYGAVLISTCYCLVLSGTGLL